MAKSKSTAVAKTGGADTKDLGFVQTEENVELLKRTLADQNTTLSDNELSLFLYQAKRTSLDPLAKQIYVIKTQGRLSFMTSIDGQRLIAQRTGEYKGQVGPQWCGPDGKWKDVWLESGNPSAARVGVLREGFDEPVYGIATWRSYAKEASATWENLGDVMLAKCAEAVAIRKAFPQELSGVYTTEEMDQAGMESQPDGSMTMQNALLSASKTLTKKGFTDKTERKQLILAIAGVEELNSLTGTLMKKVLAVVGDDSETEESLGRKYLRTDEGDIDQDLLAGQDNVVMPDDEDLSHEGIAKSLDEAYPDDEPAEESDGKLPLGDKPNVKDKLPKSDWGGKKASKAKASK